MENSRWHGELLLFISLDTPVHLKWLKKASVPLESSNPCFGATWLYAEFAQLSLPPKTLVGGPLKLKLLFDLKKSFGIFGRVPKTTMFIFGGTRTPKDNLENPMEQFQNTLFRKVLEFRKSTSVSNFDKTGTETSRRSV